jgi:hypothetical protein
LDCNSRPTRAVVKCIFVVDDGSGTSSEVSTSLATLGLTTFALSAAPHQRVREAGSGDGVDVQTWIQLPWQAWPVEVVEMLHSYCTTR